MTAQVTILGSTGSIGVNTLKVIADHPDRFSVYALTAYSSVKVMREQCQQFQPRYAVMVDEKASLQLASELKGAGLKTEVLWGEQALADVASAPDVNTVMAAIVGGAGLVATLAAARTGKKVLLANKEALVMAGELFIETVIANGAVLLPIDSEHNAIFQCLPVDNRARFSNCTNCGFEKIVLTASGGPFLTMPLADMRNVSPEQACAHPNWSMGPKVSVDSATMVNKALELIEASYLFETEPTKIEIVIHPQSIVHSMVHYCDGSVLAQMGNPDMRTPIAHGLAWPDRITSGVKSLDLTSSEKLEFIMPDEIRFPGLKTGRQAAELKGSAPILFNAANEVAVSAFLAGKLSFGQIPVIIDKVLNRLEVIQIDDLNAVIETDQLARLTAEQYISS